MFSYGSGLASTMFSLNVRKPTNDVIFRQEIESRLARRTRVAPALFEQALAEREVGEYKGSVAGLFPGTYYLSHIDEMKRRFYERTAL